jgi:uncharacterized membrane protein HdeD (DUF308 family)
MAIVAHSRWWVVLLRGLLWVAFGITALVWPKMTVWALILLFGFFAIVEGVVMAVFSVLGRHLSPQWWLSLIAGILGMAMGVVALVWPQLTALALLFLIAIRAVVVGVFELVSGIHPSVPIRNRGWVIFDGIISIIFGIVLMLLPVAGALATVWLIGVFSIVFGIIVVVLSFRLRSDRLAVAETLL